MKMLRYYTRRLLLLKMSMLMDTAVAERVPTNLAPVVPAEYDATVPNRAVLVSEKLASPCSDYPFPPAGITSADLCFDHALEETACAVNTAEGVELWVLVSEATTDFGFLQYFHNKFDSHCLFSLYERGWLIFFENNLGAAHVWVRDYAPVVSIENQQPKKLLLLPYKKWRSSEELGRTHDKSQAQALALAIADRIGLIVNDTISGPPTIHELPRIEHCFFDWGNFEADGHGVCLSTNWKSTFDICTNKTMNRGLRAFLVEHAGCEQFPGEHSQAGGLVPFPDLTRHLDIFARFIAPRKLLMTSYEKKEAVTAFDGGTEAQVKVAEKIAKSNREDFVEELDIEEKVHFEDLPTPKGVYKSTAGRGNDVIIGYANVVMIQGTKEKVLLFPTFGDRLKNLQEKVRKKMMMKEKTAKKKWMEKLGLHERNVFDIVADRMMEAGGGPHCMTKQYQFVAHSGGH